MKFTDIETERFVLKVMTPELVTETYLSWFSDSESSTFIEYAKKKTSLEDLKIYVQEKFLSEEALMLGIFSKESKKHLGNIKFEPIDMKKGKAVLGILIGDKGWRGKGLFAEISTALEKELKNCGIKTIYLGGERANLPAVKAYEKAGYINDLTNYLNSNLEKNFCMIKVLV